MNGIFSGILDSWCTCTEGMRAENKFQVGRGVGLQGQPVTYDLAQHAWRAVRYAIRSVAEMLPAVAL